MCSGYMVLNVQEVKPLLPEPGYKLGATVQVDQEAMEVEDMYN